MSQGFTAGAEPEISFTAFKVRVLLVDDQLLVVEWREKVSAGQMQEHLAVANDGCQVKWQFGWLDP